MSTTVAQIWPGMKLDVHNDGRYVETTMLSADEKWRFVDAAGHGHFWQNGYPTLRWVVLPCSMGHGDDCTSEGYYECPLCEEHVRPGTRMSEPVWVKGITSYTLTVLDGVGEVVYSFGDKEWKQLQTAMQEAVKSTLADCVMSMRAL